MNKAKSIMLSITDGAGRNAKRYRLNKGTVGCLTPLERVWGKTFFPKSRERVE